MKHTHKIVTIFTIGLFLALVGAVLRPYMSDTIAALYPHVVGILLCGIMGYQIGRDE